MNKLKYIIPLLYFWPISLFAQYPSIDNLTIVPSQPDGCDTVEVVVEGQVQNTAISVSSSSANVSGNQTDVVVYFKSQGIGNPTFVSYSETVQVGALPSGVNDLHAEARYQGSVTDSGDTTFKVQSCCNVTSQVALSSDTVCAGDTITASKTNTQGQSITWLVEGITLDSSQTIIPLSFPDSGQRIISLVTSNASCSDTASDTLTVHPLPYSTTITRNNGMLMAPQAEDYQWLFNGQPLPADTSRTITPAQEGDYRVIVTNQYGCSDTSSIQSINCAGLAQFGLSTDEVCVGDTVTATKTGPDTLAFRWLVNGIEQDSGNTVLDFAITDTGEQMIELVVDGFACKDTMQDTLMVHPYPPKPPINQPNTTELHASPSMAAGYQWLKDGQQLAGETSQILNWQQYGKGNYQVAVTNQYGCTDTSESFQVNFNNLAKRTTGSLSIYPQPASDIMVVSWRNWSEQPETIRIYNNEGKTVYKKQQFTNGEQVEVDLHHVPAGLYFIRVETQEKVSNWKLLVR